jgi:hypothetical protein
MFSFDVAATCVHTYFKLIGYPAGITSPLTISATHLINFAVDEDLYAINDK